MAVISSITGDDLTALGFKVRAVFGFSPNDEMFFTMEAMKPPMRSTGLL